MKKLIIILLISIVGMGAKAQFPTTDSLERFINQYIRNSAVQAFTNLRLNTALNGMLSFVESGVAGIDTAYRVGDSMKIVTAGNDTFTVFVGGSTQWGTNGVKIYYNSGNVGIGTNDPTSQLHIAGSSTSILLANTSTVNMLMSATGTGLGLIGNTTNHPLNFQINSGVVMYIGTGGNVAIGSAAPAASAILDMPSTIRGVLFPRMNTAQMLAISAPATSLFIWNTDSLAFCNYNGTAWVKIQGSGGTISPGGVTTDIQYNNSGAFGGSSNQFTWNNDVKTMTVGRATVSSANPAIRINDSIPIGATGSQGRPVLKIDPIDRTGAWGPVAFYANNFASKDLSGAIPNAVFTLGWNLSTGGGVVTAGKHGHGLSFERSYDPDGDGQNPWAEFHYLFVDSLGRQIRPFSYTIQPHNNTINFYHTASTFSVKNPATIHGTPVYGDYFSIDQDQMAVVGNQPVIKLHDTLDASYFTNFQQVGEDLVITIPRNLTLISGGNYTFNTGLLGLSSRQITLNSGPVSWGASGLLDVNTELAGNTLVKFKRNDLPIFESNPDDNFRFGGGLFTATLAKVEINGHMVLVNGDAGGGSDSVLVHEASTGLVKFVAQSAISGTGVATLATTRIGYGTAGVLDAVGDANFTFNSTTNRVTVDGINLVTTSTTHAPLNIGAFGTSPTSPSAGDMWFRSSDTSMVVRVGSLDIPFKWTKELVLGTNLSMRFGSSTLVPDTLDAAGGGGGDHGTLTGLTDDDHTQYALLAGRASGQTLTGGPGTTDDLIFKSTSGVGATGALIQFNVGNNGATNAITILNDGKVGIGTATPAEKLNVFSSTESVQTRIETTLSGGTAVSQVRANSSYWNTTNTGNSGAGGLATNSLGWFNDGTLRLAVSNAGLVSVGGVTTPTAWVHIPANTTTVAGLRLVASAAVNVTTPNIGELWFNGTNLYFRKDGSTSVDLLLTLVANGGTGIVTTTAYGLITGGTTATGAFQNGGTGTTGQVYVSGGSAALGTWTDHSTMYSYPQLGVVGADPTDWTAAVSTMTILPDLTSGAASRTVTLPSAATHVGRVLIIRNLSADATFKWTFASTVHNSAGSTITAIDDQKTYWLISDGTRFIITSTF